MSTPRRQNSKMEWRATRPVTKHDSSKIVAAPKHEPLKMKPYDPPKHYRQEDMDRFRDIKSLNN